MSDDKTKKPLQESFLNELRKNKTNVSVFMVNGIKLEGQILSFDQFSILLGGKIDQIVYKQKISTIAPSGHSPSSHTASAPRGKHKETT
ncbi:RNA chaperone Hfq [Kaarinaea lacus]